jgi:hypothetical protein
MVTHPLLPLSAAGEHCPRPNIDPFLSRLCLSTSRNPRSYFGCKKTLWTRLNASMSEHNGIQESYDSSISRAARGIFELEWMLRTPVLASPALCIAHLRECPGCSQSGRQIWRFVERVIKDNILVQDACSLNFKTINSTPHDQSEETDVLSLPGFSCDVRRTDDSQECTELGRSAVDVQPSAVLTSAPLVELSPALAAIRSADDVQPFPPGPPLPACAASLPSPAVILAPEIPPRWAPRSVFDKQVDYQWRASLRAASLRNKQMPTMKRLRFTLFDVDYNRVQLTGTVCKFKLLFDFKTARFPSASVPKLRKQLRQKDSDGQQKGVRFVFQVLINTSSPRTLCARSSLSL